MMANTFEMMAAMGISREVYEYGGRVLKSLEKRFKKIDEIAEYNQAKVLLAMQKNRVSAACFAGTTGYGYDDLGRDTLERVYADTFHTEAALVRPQITCGTHALAVALSANLVPGAELLSINGAPYDTLQEVIGIRPSPCSLAENGVVYRQVDLTPKGRFDFKKIKNAINDKTMLVAIQRSKGYEERPSFSVKEIAEAIAFVKSVKPGLKVMVDNCYGEFTEMCEPSDFGADMVVGSLIKNPGGGLASIGGYICGTAECVERCGYRLSAPGLGREVGANLGVIRELFQGFFLAPTVTAAAEKGAIFAAKLYEPLGFKCIPAASEERHDIIQAVELGSDQAAVRGLFPGRPYLGPRQTRNSDEPAENERGGNQRNGEDRAGKRLRRKNSDLKGLPPRLIKNTSRRPFLFPRGNRNKQKKTTETEPEKSSNC